MRFFITCNECQKPISACGTCEPWNPDCLEEYRFADYRHAVVFDDEGKTEKHERIIN